MLAILIAIAMLIFLGTNLASSTLLNGNYILAKLDETNYYNKIYEDVKSNFEKYIEQSGLEESVLENIITKEKIKKDTQLIINNLYDGLGQTVDTQEIEDNMYKNIENTLGNTNINATQKNAIDTFIKEICKEYTETLSHYEYENQIHTIYTKAMKYIDTAKKTTLIVTAMGLILVFLMNRKKIYQAFTLWGISLVIDGTFFIILYTFMCTKIKVQNILVLNEAISNTLRNMIEEIFHTINSYGYSMLGIGIVLIIVANLIHNKLKYGKQTYEK